MDRLLITGFSGFVSNHMLNYLNSKKPGLQVLGLDLSEPQFSFKAFGNLTCDFTALNLLNRAAVFKAIKAFHPSYILHLAAFSSVGLSWLRPVESFKNNTNIFLNLIEAVRKVGFKCRILSVGSSEEYGNIGQDLLPLREETQLNPVSPYAVARLAQEHLSQVFVDGYGLDIVMTRSFNHIGPGQKEVFVVSSFTKQIAEMEKAGFARGKLRTGDVSIVRDFLDVRDVVVAYDRLMQQGISGQIYNVCSGAGVSLRQIIDILSDITGISIEIEVDEGLIRPADNRILIGSNEKLRKATGWTTAIPLRESLLSTIEYWRRRLR